MNDGQISFSIGLVAGLLVGASLTSIWIGAMDNSTLVVIGTVDRIEDDHLYFRESCVTVPSWKFVPQPGTRVGVNANRCLRLIETREVAK